MEGSGHVGVHIIYEETDMFVTHLCTYFKSDDVSFIVSTLTFHLIIRLLFKVFFTLIAFALLEFFYSIILQTLQWMAVCIFPIYHSCECHINHGGTQVTGNMMEQSVLAWCLWKFGLWSSVCACNTHYPWLPITFIFK